MKNSEKQLTGRGLIVGILGLVVITASSMYVALRLGALPWPTVFVTVLSMAVLGRFKNSTLQEINVTHTIMSAGAMVAGGLAFTIPGIWMINPDAEVNVLSLIIMAVCGALLGTLFSAIYRKTLIEKLHLVYPIGNAAYKTLTTGLSKGKESVKLFVSMGFSIIFTTIRDVFGWIPSVITIFGGATNISPITMWVSPMALSIGAIIDKVSAFLWLGGCLFAYFVFIPLGINMGIFPDYVTADLARQNLGLGIMIGTGVGVLVRTFIAFAKDRKNSTEKNRVSRQTVLLSAFVLVFAAVLMAIGTEMNLWQAVLAVAGVCIATLLSGILTGQSGVNPMEVFGILILLLSQLVFKSSVTVLFLTAGIVAVACGLSGDVMNDLKSGHQLKTDPKQQLLGEGIGGVIGAVISVVVLLVMKKSFGAFGTAALPAPQAAAVASMASGLGNSPAFFIGIAIGAVLIICGIAGATLGLGIYLGPMISLTVGFGAVVSGLLKKFTKTTDNDLNLVSSGLLGGEGISGVVIAIIQMLS
ncbi:MAG: OPT/YSL family transporter [Sphaerochaetaceae bacterium]|nr:OPT/YSL family transporter [Sphaerochaetaceae bacterium]